MLVQNGADINNVDGNGHTPLHNAAEIGECLSIAVIYPDERLHNARCPLVVYELYQSVNFYRA